VQIVDARQRDHTSRHADLMAGATWHDPERVEEWIAELTPDRPVADYCFYRFDVGCNVTKTLIERGWTRASSAAASRRGTPWAARALRPLT
jgi:Fe-Mn family superoxide dismutase